MSGDEAKVSRFFERLSQTYPSGVKPTPNSKGECIGFLDSLGLIDKYNYQYCLDALERRIHLRTECFDGVGLPIHLEGSGANALSTMEGPSCEKKALCGLEENMHKGASIEADKKPIYMHKGASSEADKKALYQLAKNMHEYREQLVERGELSEAEARAIAQDALMVFIASRR
jgi:hypothetical protein